MLHEEVIKYRELSGDINPNTPISRIGGYLDGYEKALEQVRKTGQWVAQNIHNCHTDFKCSECGYIHSFMHLYDKPTADYTYCPNCGAKMVESQE